VTLGSVVDGSVSGCSGTSEVTFAYCRFGGDSQKYTTLLYTNDAATVLDQLSGPEYQCNHPPRSHKTQIAGGIHKLLARHLVRATRHGFHLCQNGPGHAPSVQGLG